MFHDRVRWRDDQPTGTEGYSREHVVSLPRGPNYLTEENSEGFHVYKMLGAELDLGTGTGGGRRQTTGNDASGSEANGVGAESWVGSKKRTTGYRIEDVRMRRTRDQNGNGDIGSLLEQLNARMDRVEKALIIIAGGEEEGEESTDPGEDDLNPGRGESIDVVAARQRRGTRDSMPSMFRPSRTIAKINANNRKHYHIN